MKYLWKLKQELNEGSVRKLNEKIQNHNLYMLSILYFKEDLFMFRT